MSENAELRQLALRSADGTASATQMARLNELLRGQPELRDEYLGYLDTHATLCWEFRGQAVSQTSDARQAAPNVTAVMRTSDRRSRFVRAASLAVVAASVVFVVYWLRTAVEPTARGVAVLTHAVDAVWSDDAELRSVGAVLSPGTLHLKSGAALIEFYSGARVVIEGPSDFQLISTSEAFMKSGRINAHVPLQAHGFKVRTVGFDIVDRGTDFGLHVATSATGMLAAEVHVFEGLVELTESAGKSQTRSLNTGEAVRIEHDATVAMASDRSAFLLEDELAQRETAAQQVRLNQWRVASRSLRSDPAIVLHYSFEDGPVSPTGRVTAEIDTTANDQSALGLSTTNGSVVGCEWVTGRWDKKLALQFRRESDRVRFNVANPLREVTLLAWIRVDALPHGMNALMSADDEQVGALLWELTSNGRLRLEIGRDLGRKKLDWESINSEPVVTPDRFGQWLLLATTFDGSTIRHFVNGKPCGKGASFRPPALHIGTAELANWRGRVLRHFVGAMDEFAILNRVMSEAEQRDYFERGQP
jgi:hypothetical protein